MLKSSHIHVNYDKIRKGTQRNENPAFFLPRITEAVQKYTNLDISIPAELLYLHVQFISQSATDVYQELCQKAMAPHSSTLAWKIPWMEKPGRLWSMGSLRVIHD